MAESTWRELVRKADNKGVVHKLATNSVKLSRFGPRWYFSNMGPWTIKHITKVLTRRLIRMQNRRMASDARHNSRRAARETAQSEAVLALEKVLS